MYSGAFQWGLSCGARAFWFGLGCSHKRHNEHLPLDRPRCDMVEDQRRQRPQRHPPRQPLRAGWRGLPPRGQQGYGGQLPGHLQIHRQRQHLVGPVIPRTPRCRGHARQCTHGQWPSLAGELDQGLFLRNLGRPAARRIMVERWWISGCEQLLAAGHRLQHDGQRHRGRPDFPLPGRGACHFAQGAPAFLHRAGPR